MRYLQLSGREWHGSTGLKEGNYVTLRWRDKNGAFDAAQVKITGIFKTNVPSVDAGQVWIPIDMLRDMMLLPEEATILVCRDKDQEIESTARWDFKEQDELLVDLQKIIRSKSMAGVVIWAILLMVAMLAIFDTQVLSIFRRQREIGTYVALGYDPQAGCNTLYFRGSHARGFCHSSGCIIWPATAFPPGKTGHQPASEQ